jgi:predicted nucleic acid-binding protein
MPVGKVVGKAKPKIHVGKVVHAKPSIYIDTNICRDFIRRKRGIRAIQTLGIIRDRGYGCFTSILTAMELTDTEKDSIYFNKKMRTWDVNTIIRSRHEKDLGQEDLKEAKDSVKAFFTENSFIKFVNLVGEKAWDLALTYSSNSNLFAPDVIHLVTAWTSGCSVLLTSDEFFIKEGNKILKKEGVLDRLRICRPKDLSNTLEDLGFKENGKGKD